jgi:hypothetical protein
MPAGEPSRLDRILTFFLTRVMVVTKFFGTDGIRAHAGEFPLNSPSIVAIGRAIGEKLRGKILVGQDTRLSSPWIHGLLTSGIRTSSAEIEDAGVIPTPAIALLAKEYGYSGGVMISASHNPYADNGIKVFSSDGTKLSDADEVVGSQSHRLAGTIPECASGSFSGGPVAGWKTYCPRLCKWGDE